MLTREEQTQVEDASQMGLYKSERVHSIGGPQRSGSTGSRCIAQSERGAAPGYTDLRDTGAMSEKPSAQPGEPKEAEKARAKKPYRKPAFEWERAFETMALACGKVNISQSQCKLNRKVS
jgi:hypothetical protein